MQPIVFAARLTYNQGRQLLCFEHHEHSSERQNPAHHFRSVLGHSAGHGDHGGKRLASSQFRHSQLILSDLPFKPSGGAATDYAAFGRATLGSGIQSGSAGSAFPGKPRPFARQHPRASLAVIRPS